MIQNIQVKKILSDSEMKSKKGSFSNDYNLLINFDCDIFTENGSILLKFRKNNISNDIINIGFKSYLEAGKQYTDNRGDAAGRIVNNKLIHRNILIGDHPTWEKHTKVQSGIIGYIDSKNWRNKCRETAFTKKYYDKYKQGLPFIQYINNLYKLLEPDKYNKQLAETSNIQDYIIQNTCFSTVTINHNFRTAIHKDSGDFPDGIGNLTVIENGENKYKGGYTLFPQYGIAVDVRQGDFLLMDVHQWHCNSTIEPISNDFLRLSFVCYLRKNMTKCKMVEQLLEKQLNLTTNEKILEMVGNNHTKNILGTGNYGHIWYEYIGNGYIIKYYNKQYTIHYKDIVWTNLTKAYYDFIQSK